MHRRSSALSRTTWRTIETTVAAEIRDAKEGRLWLKRRPVASRGSHLTLLCIMAKARCSVPVAAPESSHVLSTMTTEAPVRSGPAQNRAGRHRGSSPRPGGENTPWPCRPADIEFDVIGQLLNAVYVMTGPMNCAMTHAVVRPANAAETARTSVVTGLY